MRVCFVFSLKNIFTLHTFDYIEFHHRNEMVHIDIHVV